MTGLIVKDFLVLDKRFYIVFRILCAFLLIGAAVLFPEKSAVYIPLMLPAMGMAFLTELVKVDEMSDWKDYLPALPITSREIVLSRYLFSVLFLVGLSVISCALCGLSAWIGKMALADFMTNYILGVWFAILMLIFGIPSGYLFKNEFSTGAMVVACVIFGMIHNTGIEGTFFSISLPWSYIVLLLATIVMLYTSYKAALWIYSTKRYAKVTSIPFR